MLELSWRTFKPLIKWKRVNENTTFNSLVNELDNSLGSAVQDILHFIYQRIKCCIFINSFLIDQREESPPVWLGATLAYWILVSDLVPIRLWFFTVLVLVLGLGLGTLDLGLGLDNKSKKKLTAALFLTPNPSDHPVY